LLARRPTKVAVIVLANKFSRMRWAMMAMGEHYKEPAALAGVNEIAGDQDNPLVPAHRQCELKTGT
jgi:hypothetical protein